MGYPSYTDKGTLITYAGNKKREQNLEENLLNKKIELLEEEFNLNQEDIETFSNFKEAKDKLQEIREIKLKGALIRARAQTLNFSEKPTKLFLNCENNNFISKNMRELKLNDGCKEYKPDKILEEMWVFYSKLYDKKETIDLEETGLKEIGKKTAQTK